MWLRVVGNVRHKPANPCALAPTNGSCAGTGERTIYRAASDDEHSSMSPRPRFTSKLTKARNAVLGVVLRPFRWFSPSTQLAIGFATLVLATTLLLTRWPLNLNSIAIFVLVVACYFVVWRFVDYRGSAVDLFISKRRAFALVGSAIVVETAVMRLGFIVAGGLSAQSTRVPLN